MMYGRAMVFARAGSSFVDIADDIVNGFAFEYESEGCRDPLLDFSLTDRPWFTVLEPYDLPISFEEIDLPLRRTLIHACDSSNDVCGSRKVVRIACMHTNILDDGIVRGPPRCIRGKRSRLKCRHLGRGLLQEVPVCDLACYRVARIAT